MSDPQHQNESEPLTHPWRRFVALGDSFTEGIGDPDPLDPTTHRGWADLVAAQLGQGVPDFEYANLAVRGRLLQQILDEQLQPALEMAPDLVSLCAGGNDILRRADPDDIATALDDAVGTIRATGADVILWAIPDFGKSPVLSLIRGRAAICNENIRAVAARHGAHLVDLWALRELTHEAMWAEDRLHFSSIGHRRIAVEALDTLGLEHSLEPAEVGEPHTRSARDARRENLTWMREHFGPWVVRRIRGVSSGDNISPKRPEAAPIFGQAMPMGVSAAEADPERAEHSGTERTDTGHADAARANTEHPGTERTDTAGVAEDGPRKM